MQFSRLSLIQDSCGGFTLIVEKYLILECVNVACVNTDIPFNMTECMYNRIYVCVTKYNRNLLQMFRREGNCICII